MLKKWYHILVGLTASVPMLACALDVQLTDAITRNTEGFSLEVSISENGGLAYLLYPINVDDTVVPPINLAAEIFRNNQGTLQSVATLLGDTTFPIIDDGFANRNFTTFSFLDDNNTDTVRLRLFDQNFNQKAVTTFSDFAPGDPNNPSFSFLGGQFSDDGKYIVVSYLTNATPGSQQTIVRVLDAQNLSLIASTQVSGGSPGTNFITIDHETYVVLTTYGGDFIFSFENSLAAAPSTLFVYQLNHNQLTLVAQAPLPQQASSPTVFSKGRKASIGVGTVRANLSGEETIFTNSIPSFLANDNRELRIYQFDGCKLKLVLAKETGTTTNAPTFSSRGLVMVNEQAFDGAPGFFNFYSFNQRRLSFIDGTFVSPPFITSVFSQDGKWLLLGGSNQDAQLNNINLYRIISPKQKSR